MLDVRLPINISTGPSTATMRPIVKMTFFVESSRLLNFCTRSDAVCIICVMLGSSVPIKSISAFFASFSALANFWLVVSVTFWNASSVAPLQSCISRRISLYSAPSSRASTIAAEPASTLPNISFSVLPSASAASESIFRMSDVELPSAFRSAKPLPVSSRRVVSVMLPDLVSSFSMDFK